MAKPLLLLAIMIPLSIAGCGPPPESKFNPVAAGLKPANTTWSGGELRTYSAGLKKKGQTTVIFVHGSPGSASGWGQYLEDGELRKRFHLVSYDRPGYGESGQHWKPLGQQVQALDALIEQQPGEVILVGHSLGGPIVLGAAADRGKKISHTFVLAGSVDPRLGPTRPLNAFLKYTATQYLLPKPWRISNEEVHGLKPELKKLAGKLGEIKTPVTIIQGKQDKLVPFANVAYLEQKLTGVEPRIVYLENEGHFLPWRQYDLVKTRLLALPR